LAQAILAPVRLRLCVLGLQTLQLLGVEHGAVSDSQ